MPNYNGEKYQYVGDPFVTMAEKQNMEDIHRDSDLDLVTILTKYVGDSLWPQLWPWICLITMLTNNAGPWLWLWPWLRNLGVGISISCYDFWAKLFQNLYIGVKVVQRQKMCDGRKKGRKHRQTLPK